MRQCSVCFFLAIVAGAAAVAWAQYPTSNVTLLSHLTNSQIGESLEGADIWGWTDSQTNKDYALFASQSGTSFVDVTDGAHPMLSGKAAQLIRVRQLGGMSKSTTIMLSLCRTEMAPTACKCLI